MEHKKIILIEDDADMRQILASILQKAEFDVSHCFEGKDVVNGNLHEPDLYIVDYKTPTIDGLALCKYLRINKRTNRIPIIVMSGNHGIKRKAIKAGANEFLCKPFKEDDLLASVRRALP